MRIHLTSVFVDDQDKAREFYTGKLGFVVKNDLPYGPDRWLTLTAAGDENGVELLLEPAKHPAAQPFQQALKTDGIPFASFAVDDCRAEYQRLLALGVRFTQEPADLGPMTMAVLDDTCGNLICLTSTTKTD
ncbi:VOC family protein [Kineosporia babensis]|uniref:VOC family protein n=1 Tax=Kineosporia babensis TaxID=499548 RepID=A0A9X1NHQ8_9ACTN|nr:VOC family protein [Kineosporia babensis]MCD5313338.1 VOC family protein [Kineosporia babensis]